MSCCRLFFMFCLLFAAPSLSCIINDYKNSLHFCVYGHKTYTLSMLMVLLLNVGGAICVKLDVMQGIALRIFFNDLGCTANRSTLCPFRTFDFNTTDCLTTPAPTLPAPSFLRCDEKGSLTILYMNTFRSPFRIDGSLSTVIGLLSHLQMLTFAGIGVTHRIPSEIGLLSNLTSLWLADNNFTGTLPTELSRLSQLTYINVAGNDLFGNVPLLATSILMCVLQTDGNTAGNCFDLTSCPSLCQCNATGAICHSTTTSVSRVTTSITTPRATQSTTTSRSTTSPRATSRTTMTTIVPSTNTSSTPFSPVSTITSSTPVRSTMTTISIVITANTTSTTDETVHNTSQSNPASSSSTSTELVHSNETSSWIYGALGGIVALIVVITMFAFYICYKRNNVNENQIAMQTNQRSTSASEYAAFSPEKVASTANSNAKGMYGETTLVNSLVGVRLPISRECAYGQTSFGE